MTPEQQIEKRKGLELQEYDHDIQQAALRALCVEGFIIPRIILNEKAIAENKLEKE